MKNLKTKSLIAGFVFVLAFALAGTPDAPVTSIVPTVGGVASAYAPPCNAELLAMQTAWANYQRGDGNWAYLIYLSAVWDYYGCLYG